MIENEIKMLLNIEKVEKITTLFSEKYVPQKTIIQVNYYYDTKDFSLFNSGESLRIRQKCIGLTLDYKSKKTIK